MNTIKIATRFPDSCAIQTSILSGNRTISARSPEQRISLEVSQNVGVVRASVEVKGFAHAHVSMERYTLHNDSCEQESLCKV